MKCSFCDYTGPAMTMCDQAGKPVNVCPECQNPIAPKIRPWERLGITRARYLGTQPWKKARMSREAFETQIAFVPLEAIDLLRREAEANMLIAAMGLE